MSDAPRGKTRWRGMPLDPEPIDRMLWEIDAGVPKASSRVPMTPELSALWDRLTVQVAEGKAKGFELAFGLDWDDEDVT